jgi:capsular exopolysaccharide synthesis family protein
VSHPVAPRDLHAEAVLPDARADGGARREAASGVDPHLVSLLSPESFEADQYRGLRHFLEHARPETGLKVVGITSPVAGDGKTITAVNLALTLVQSRRSRVLLVDADLRQPSVAADLGLASSERGLASAVLEDEVTLGSLVRKTPYGLDLLAASSPAANPYAVLESPRVAALVDAARESYDYVIVDTPPVLLVPDCKLIGRLVDAFLVVVAAHRTPRKLLAETLSAMDPAKVLGLVFNGDARALSNYKRYGGSYYDAPAARRGRRGWLAWSGRK